MKRGLSLALGIWALAGFGGSARAEDVIEGLTGAQPRVTSRAHVRVALETLTGTSQADLDAANAELAKTVSKVRECYAKIADDRPTVEGRIRLSLERKSQRAKNRVTVHTKSVDDTELERCVTSVVGRTSLRAVKGSFGVAFKLCFHNSAARGVRASEARSEASVAAAITEGKGGEHVAKGQTPGGEVHYTLRGIEGTGVDAVGAYFGGMRDMVGALLDCRRKASKRESPAGEASLKVTKKGRGSVRVTTRSITVPNERAKRCIERALKSAHKHAKSPNGTFDVAVRFVGT